MAACGAITVFVTGHSYAQGGFPTQTTIIDLDTGTTIADLEADFTICRDGERWRRIDFNFWGVTFVDDRDHFFATLGTGGRGLPRRGLTSPRRKRPSCATERRVPVAVSRRHLASPTSKRDHASASSDRSTWRLARRSTWRPAMTEQPLAEDAATSTTRSSGWTTRRSCMASLPKGRRLRSTRGRCRLTALAAPGSSGAERGFNHHRRRDTLTELEPSGAWTRCGIWPPVLMAWRGGCR